MSKTNNPQRNSFVFYRSFYESIHELPERMRGPLLVAIAEYGLNQVAPDFGTGQDAIIMRAIWSGIYPQLDANFRKFLNGLKGGAPRGNNNADKNKPRRPDPRRDHSTNPDDFKSTI